MESARPKLSICIPTFNRATLLDRCLEGIMNYSFGFSFEVVVSDNASPDRTPAVVEKYRSLGLPIFYVRQTHNVGVYGNHCNALRHGRGEYLIFLGDDDALIPEGIVNAVAYLDRDVNLQAVFAPLETYDELTDTVVGYTCENDSNKFFAKGAVLDLFNFLISSSFRPEVGVYRAECIGSTFIPRHFNGSPYTNLVNLMLRGGILVAEKPFYRFIVRSNLNPDQSHEGIGWAREYWNQERGGLEELFVVLTDTIGVNLTDDMRRELGVMLDVAEATRIIMAMTLCAKTHDYLQAYELFIRARTIITRNGLSMSMFGPHAQRIPEFFGRVQADVVRQALACMTDIKDIIIFQVPESEAWMTLFKEWDDFLKYEITIVDNPELLFERDISRALFLTSDQGTADKLISFGVRSGFVISGEVLLKRYAITPTLLA